jgi:hypothetical protein
MIVRTEILLSMVRQGERHKFHRQAMMIDMSLRLPFPINGLCRFMAESLAATIYRSSATDPNQFAMLLGIGDSSNFGSETPTWSMASTAQDKCYVGAHLGSIRTSLILTLSVAILHVIYLRPWGTSGSEKRDACAFAGSAPSAPWQTGFNVYGRVSHAWETAHKRSLAIIFRF